MSFTAFPNGKSGRSNTERLLCYIKMHLHTNTHCLQFTALETVPEFPSVLYSTFLITCHIFPFKIHYFLLLLLLYLARKFMDLGGIRVSY